MTHLTEELKEIKTTRTQSVANEIIIIICSEKGTYATLSQK